MKSVSSKLTDSVRVARSGRAKALVQAESEPSAAPAAIVSPAPAPAAPLAVAVVVAAPAPALAPPASATDPATPAASAHELFPRRVWPD